MDFIKNLEPILICDIGASACDPTNHIEDLLNNTKSLLYGFEPNKEEYLKLTSRIDNTKKKYFDKAIGDGTEKEFNICNYPGWSSFLIPEKEYVKNFANFENDSIILKKEKIKTERLDDINFENEIDLLKIDSQGYESIIIDNGKKTASDCLVVQLELSPIPIYKNEKKMSYVFNQVEELGFNLNMFSTINTKTFKPVVIGKNPLDGLHTIFQLDCVFVPSFEKLNNLDEEKLKKLILIMFYSYKSYDFVDYLIRLLDKKAKSNLIYDYRNLLKNINIIKKY